MEEFSPNKANRFKVLTVLAIAASLSLGAYMYSAKEVTLELDGNEREVTTYAETVEDLLHEEEILLDKLAYVSVPLDTKLENNMKIIIKTPKLYTLAIGNDMVEVKSIYTKVRDVLNDLNVHLGDLDYTEPALDEKLSYGDKISITRVEEVIEEIEEVIAHDSIVQKSNKLDIGTSKVIQEGKDGVKIKKIKNVFENGKLVQEILVGEEVQKEAIPKIIEKGTRSVAKTTRGNVRYKKVLTMTATAYDNSYESTGKYPGDKYWGLTAMGTKARVGAVAVDPRVIPLGTKLYVESLDGTKDYGFCVAEDTGGAIKGNKIDLFFNTASEVRRFGRRKVKVYILD
ncbi:MAG: DUF348 domain-containing protein [Tissierellia bacterium]|nr:DUF348 domain-containing protein [Tissierellia bacterium]